MENLFWIALLAGGFCLTLCIGVGIVNILYNTVPAFRNWANKGINSISEQDEEVF